ncbi:MAG: glycine--tRNA ligase subunit beta [Syntrophomonadaceae bacterium]|nr:glycine--tRNA ligase subunit beta [Syntrophomonadaceae bacterium]
MAKDLLLEIGVEEIPSAYMPGAIADLKALAGLKFDHARLDYKEISVYGTPRRLVLVVSGLNEEQQDALNENRGPKKSLAFDVEGNPSKAGLGFARGQGVDFKDLEIRKVAGIEYIFAIKKEKGTSSDIVLPELLLSIINSLVFPKSMRWAYYNTRFARPIRWLVAIYGDKKIDLHIENIKSVNYTYGHRFLSLGPVGILDVESYLKALANNFVILDQQVRKELIWKQIVQAAAEAGGKPMENEKLLEEITYLVEYPTAFYGQFSPSYLDVPPEVLTTSMIEHQRYFPVFDADGRLMAGFVGVRNGTDFSLDTVRAGNERVLKARLEDALFFWNEDTKKSLSDMAPGLKDVLFHEQLGSIMDKVERLQKLAVYIGDQNNLSNEVQLQRAAYLCKADLLSNMVYEFPELQGIMGRYYAQKSGEDSEVSEAIWEHYLPRFAGDRLPSTPCGTVLSLAEKLDNLVGCFCIGIKPTGSQDPYALRRQAIGIVNIILESALRIDLEAALASAYDGFKAIKPDISKDQTITEVLDFIRQRMRAVLLEQGIGYDVVDAVLAMPNSDLNDIKTRARSVQQFKQAEEFSDFMVVFNRSYNLSKKWDKEEFDLNFLIEDSEKKLYNDLVRVRESVKKNCREQDYATAMRELASLRISLDSFFAAVMVMVDEEGIKAARLGLLKAIANLYQSISDFSKIV